MESAFRQAAGDGIELFETFRWERDTGAVRGDRHLARMERSAARLGFAFDRKRAGWLMAVISGEGTLRVRMVLNPSGAFSVSTTPFAPETRTWQLTISDRPVQSGDPWLGIKTTNRPLYDRTRAKLPEGVDEVLFVNERGELAEGTITNIFVPSGDILLTPPLASGCLPGVLREELLSTGQAREAVLRPADLRGRPFFVGNSLRDLVPALLRQG